MLYELIFKLRKWTLRRFFFLIAFIIGLLHAWFVRYGVDCDGTSYLDMGDAYFRGDWRAAINGYWSPLYSWILGFVLYVLKPASCWESTIVHFTNFLIYLIAFFLLWLFPSRVNPISQTKRSWTMGMACAWLLTFYMDLNKSCNSSNNNAWYVR